MYEKKVFAILGDHKVLNSCTVLSVSHTTQASERYTICYQLYNTKDWDFMTILYFIWPSS